MLAAVITVLCQVCALADYFHPPNADRPTLTIGDPCPGGTREVERNGEIVTCEQDAHRSLRVSFDEQGRVESYVTLIDGERNGVSQRWHANGALAEDARWNGDQLHGVRRVFDEQRKLVLEENWIRNAREGSYKRKVNGKDAEYGRYKAGERVGTWHEWHTDRVAVGNYDRGRRIGLWNLTLDEAKIMPDYTVSFADDGTVVDAQGTTKKYGEVMLLADGAMIALGLYGHFSDKPALEYAGAAGLVAAGPIVHALYQPSGQRLAKLTDSTILRLGAPVAVFAVYSFGKFLAAFDCTEKDPDPSANGQACNNYSYDYNTDYNIDAIKLATAIVIAAGDYAAAYRTSKTTVREAWPTLSVGPTAHGNGAEVSVAGRF